MTLVLLLLAVKLPMTAGEASGVTVHQAEWGDTRGEAPPPSGPSVPVKDNSPAPVFRSSGFNYGEGLQYGGSGRYGGSIRYAPGTTIRTRWGRHSGAYQPNVRYSGTGRIMRDAYKPNISYGSGVQYRGSHRYGLSR